MKRIGFQILGVAAFTFFALASAGVASAKDYARSKARCGPFPKVAVSTAPGLCLGLVTQDAKGLRFPRVLLEVEPGIFWLTDMGGWNPGRGKLWRLNVQQPDAPRLRLLDEGLDRPHGLVRDAQGRVYLGTAGAVWRYDPSAPNPAASKKRVVEGLPTQGRHPLTNLAYDPAGALIINVGAPSDHCELDPDAPDKVALPCPSVQGPKPEAALYRAVIQGDLLGPPELLAEGLRNSMALAFHPQSGLLLQGENNIDYKEADQPKEELNIIRPGAHYGWPYCIEDQRRARHYRRGAPLDCRKTEAPARLLPAHAAPLGLVFSGSDGLPGYEQHWLIGYHGYRASGHRIVAIGADNQGRPSGALTELVFDWDKRAGRHPRGAPVALSFDHQGRLWMADDRNKAILVLMAEDPSRHEAPPSDETPGDGALAPGLELSKIAAQPNWQGFFDDQLVPRCGDCHGAVLKGGSAQALARLVADGWLTPLTPKEGLIYRAILGEEGQALMPPPKGLAGEQRAAWRRAILSFRLQP